MENIKNIKELANAAISSLANILPNEFKFKTFGDAYIVMQDVFFLGNSKGYVTYGDLLNIIEKRTLNYQVGIDGYFRNPVPLEKNILNKFGWDNGRGIKLGLPSQTLNPVTDSNVLYMPEIKILNKYKEEKI